MRKLRLPGRSDHASGPLTPFFSVPPIAADSGRRLLLISYHFPPGGSVGALRWQKMARIAAERGWELDVVTAEPPPGDRTGWDRLQDLPVGTRVYGVPERTLLMDRLESTVWRGYKQLRQRRRASRQGGRSARRGAPAARPRRPASFKREEVRWLPQEPRDLLRAYWAWRAAARDLAWAADAAEVAKRIATPGVHQAVISSAPPHWTHEAGRRVSLVSGLPYVMDLRDPWSHTEQLLEPVASPVWLRLARHYERRAVRQASVVVANTELLQRAMGATYPGQHERIICAMNGCDDEEPLPRVERGERFVIGYAGTIYFDRTPRSLFRAAARVIEELALTPADFGMEFIGHLESGQGPTVAEIAAEEGVEEFVRVGGAQPRAAAREFMARASMLVSLPWSHKMAIPAKIFEYMQFDAWMLVLAGSDSAPWLLLRGTDADVVAPDDVEGIARAIRERYRMHRDGVRPTRITRDGRFSRRGQATVVLDALEAALPRR